MNTLHLRLVTVGEAISLCMVFSLLCIFVMPLISCGEGETVDRTVELGSNTEEVCTPESRDCNENDVVKCDASGREWVFFKECGEDLICEEGDCTDEQGDGDGEDEDLES